jgi:hypothetical protein
LALFSDLTLGTLVVLLIVMPLYLARRRRDRQRMAALLAADAQQAEHDAALLDELLESAPPELEAPPRPDEGNSDDGSTRA